MSGKQTRVWCVLALLCGTGIGGCSGTTDPGDADADAGSAGDATDGDADSGNTDGGSTDGGNTAQCPDGERIPCELEVLPSTGDPAQDCVNRVNQFREECLCLPPLERWTEKEACSNTQSSDDAQSGGAHANFGACGEWGQCTCPGWGGGTDAIIGGCLQMMWDEGPGEGPEHGHYNIMSSKDYTKVACGFFAMENGDIWANQNYGN